MSFLNDTKKKYVLASTLGFMSKKEMQTNSPHLFKAYTSVYGNDRPDVKIESTESFSFPQEEYSQGSWHVIFLVRGDDVKPVNVAQYYGTQHKLQPNDMVLDCMTGNFNFCRLYVHPQNAAPLLKPAQELTDEEYLALHCMKTLKAFAREEEYTRLKYKDWQDQLKHKDEYKTIMKQLATKGLVKINAAGAATITLEGKNVPSKPEVLKKFRGY